MVGIEAILTRLNKPTCTLYYHLGTDDEHMVYKVELKGILLGIHLIKTEKRYNTICLIRINNQAAIKAFHLEYRNPGQHLAYEILKTANKISKKEKRVNTHPHTTLDSRT
jgi:hypothetical protein